MGYVFRLYELGFVVLIFGLLWLTGCWRDCSGLRERKWQKAWEKLHNKELQISYYSRNIIIVLCEGGWDGLWLEKMRNAYRILFWRPEGRRTLGKSSNRLEHNIKMYLKIRLWGVDCMWLKIGQASNSCNWGNEPLRFMKCKESFNVTRFCRKSYFVTQDTCIITLRNIRCQREIGRLFCRILEWIFPAHLTIVNVPWNENKYCAIINEA
jgi:hypothetical protein